MSSPEHRSETDRQQRLHRLLRGELTGTSGSRREIMVRNISSSGIGCASRGDPVARGERVTIDLPRIGSVNGIVRWSKGPAFGVELDRRVDLDVVADAVRSFTTATTPASSWEVKRMHRVASTPPDPGKLRQV